jgi:cardiolipin synthase
MISVLPNAITLSRLLSVPFLAIMLSSNDYLVAFWFFLALGLSDGLDGYIARRYDAITTIGILLDPVADKLLVITCASILTWNGILPLWVGIPLVVRDVAMLSIGLLDSKLKETRVMPNLWGKSHAALAFLAIGIAIAQAANLFDYDVILELIWPAVVVTLAVSTTVYFLEWRRLRIEYDSNSSVAM